jgi:hypothetical protein
VIRRRGLADVAAAATLGISKATLWRWKRDHPDLEDWLAMAREDYREAKLAIVDEAKMADGRPDWRAATWALAKAFPEDYGRNAGAARAVAAQSGRPSLAEEMAERQREMEGWVQSQLTPEMKELIRQANEETEAILAQEAGEAPSDRD